MWLFKNKIEVHRTDWIPPGQCDTVLQTRFFGKLWCLKPKVALLQRSRRDLSLNGDALSTVQL